jgi:hypothetical protein
MSQLYRSPSPASRRTGSFLLLALMMMTLQLSVAAPAAQAAPKPKPSSITLVPTITSISVQNGQLFASGFVTATIKGTTHTVEFTGVPVNISLAGGQAGACPILDLRLGPIDLNLLGLRVQTSEICLTITAFEDQGLLGELLCAIGNLLNGGLNLSQILDILASPTGLVDPAGNVFHLNDLTSGLTGLFNGGLRHLLRAILRAIDIIGQHGTCAILHLELGPLQLDLLGLRVELDNCHNGPVTVDITGQTGPGNLLGNLLCGLLDDGLLNIGLTLEQILDLILGLLN